MTARRGLRSPMWLGAALFAASLASTAQAETLLPLAPVDVDDDDHDGVIDGADEKVPADLVGDLIDLGALGKGTPVTLAEDGARLIVDGKPRSSPLTQRGRTLLAQGKKPGRFELTVGDQHATLRFVEVRFVDESGATVDLARSGVDLSRSPPARLADEPMTPAGDNGFRALVIADPADQGTELDLTSFAENGARIDALEHVETREVSCPPDVGQGLRCRSTLPVRLAIDTPDRTHPVSRDRSLQSELGGGVLVSLGGRKLALARTLGPRKTDVGAIDRFRARLRVMLVRERAKGAPPFGVSDQAALALARTQIARSNAVWGQCGVSFGDPEKADVRLVDPPIPQMLAVGCDLGLPASGGELRVRVDGHEVRTSWESGESARSVSRRIARAIEARGLVSVVSDNLRIGPGAAGSSDVLVRRRDGTPALVEEVPAIRCAPGATCAPMPLSTDPTMSLCLGVVDLSDGLQHFSDVDAVAGTLEERSPIKALDDGDPRTIEVFLIPSFATGGRIGESFIFGDHSSIANMLIEDRAGIRADAVSFALAHELGHVLLDVPGHADDFGVDTPTRLMDSDAADPSPFGPRRLTAGECSRAIRQAGPKSQGILAPWPLAKLVPRR